MRILPAPEDGRVETGGLMFKDDFPGFFIRGDTALYIAGIIASIKPENLNDMDKLSWKVIQQLGKSISNDVPLSQWREKGLL